MKKVLIINHWYPPYPFPSTRIIGLGKYLPEFGWQPIVLTSSLGHVKPQFRVIETPYRDVLGFWKRLLGLKPDESIRRQLNNRFGVAPSSRLKNFIFTRLGEVINYPDLHRGWKPFAIRAGREILEREKIDVVLSSAIPIISHLIARELKMRYQVPWLADFRDLWSQNHNYSYGPLRKWIDRRLELKTLSPADALVTTSEPFAAKLRILHQGKEVSAITNGFDQEETNSPPAQLAAKFTITYTGRIYPKGHEPAKLFAALRDLVSVGTIPPDDIAVRFYGPKDAWVEREITRYGLSAIVKHNGMVIRETALAKQRESQLLLLLKWEDPQEQGIYTQKVFEYLSARRPILATGGSRDVVDDLFNDTGAGICAPTIDDIKNVLAKLYQQYKSQGAVAYQGVEAKANQYSHREMAARFAVILNRSCGAKTDL